VLTNDIVEEFARLLFHKLQKVAIFTSLCKGLEFFDIIPIIVRKKWFIQKGLPKMATRYVPRALQ